MVLFQFYGGQSKVEKGGNFKNTLGLVFLNLMEMVQKQLQYCIIWIVTHLLIITQHTQPSANAYLGVGVSAIVLILTISLLQTGLLEEFLFRGFVNKRLVYVLGDKIGITLQAIIFGSLHLLLASNVTGGFMLGYIAEKSFNGSVLPGVVLHGIGNLIINIIQAFSQ